VVKKVLTCICSGSRKEISENKCLYLVSSSTCRQILWSIIANFSTLPYLLQVVNSPQDTIMVIRERLKSLIFFHSPRQRHNYYSIYRALVASCCKKVSSSQLCWYRVAARYRSAVMRMCMIMEWELKNNCVPAQTYVVPTSTRTIPAISSSNWTDKWRVKNCIIIIRGQLVIRTLFLSHGTNCWYDIITSLTYFQQHGWLRGSVV